MRITGDDEIGTAGERAREHGIVIGIGCNGRGDLGRHDDLHQVSISGEQRRNAGAGALQAASDLRSPDDIEQLIE